MITAEIKQALEKEIMNLISTDFSPMDVYSFIAGHSIACELLLRHDCCGYDEQIAYIHTHETEEIMEILSMPHSYFYDSFYGSGDPIPLLRLSKSDLLDEDDSPDRMFSADDIREMDNVFSHLLFAIDEEDEEIPLDSVLKRDNLNKLLENGYDCSAKQIYYFEKEAEDKYYFGHYFKCRNGEWDCFENHFDTTDIDGFIFCWMHDEKDARDAESHFFFDLENSYREFSTSFIMESTLRTEVFNGVNAINDLKDAITPFVRICAIRAAEKNNQGK